MRLLAKIVGKQEDGDPDRRPGEDGAGEVRLERAAGPRVELVEGVRGEADQERPGELARREQPDERDPHQLEDAGRRPRAQVGAEAPLGAAPEIVGEAERGNERHGRVATRSERGAHER